MNKLCLIVLGSLLFALYLAQVQAQSSVSPTNRTMAPNSTTVRPAAGPINATTANSTWDKSSGGRTEVSVLLLPLALGFLWS